MRLKKVGEVQGTENDYLRPVTVRAVVFSPFFFPEMISTGRYNTHLCKAMVSRGVQVDVVTSYPLYPDWRPKYTEKSIEGVGLYRGGAYIRYPKSAPLRRLVLELWFAWHSIASIWRTKNAIDLAVIVIPPVVVGLPVRWLLPRRARMIAIVHDLQGQMIESGIVTGKGVLGRIVSGVERQVLRRCDKVICLSSSMADVVINEMGVDRRRCEIKYPFVMAPSARAGGNLEDIFEKDYIHVVYSGGLGKKQLPLLLLEVFEALSRIRSDIVCHIFSGGPIFDELQRRKDQTISGRVHFHDLVPESDLAELYERSHIQVIPQAPGTGAAAFPSKFPNLLAAGVPIFAICDPDSELSHVVAECGGMTSVPGKAAGLANKISSFVVECSRETHAQRSERLRQYVEGHFSVKNLVDAILKT